MKRIEHPSFQSNLAEEIVFYPDMVEHIWVEVSYYHKGN